MKIQSNKVSEFKRNNSYGGSFMHPAPAMRQRNLSKLNESNWKKGIIKRSTFPINDKGKYRYTSLGVNDPSLVTYEEFLKIK
jgi:hypothetical protein